MISAIAREAKRVARRLIERDRPVILMYHRVARLTHDPWRLAVSPERFAEQIEALAQFRHIVPLRWLAAQLARGRLPKKVAVITFDDGYLDLLAEAKPILERYACPATAFLVTGLIGDLQPFWWDDLTQLIFETPVLPTELEVEIAGHHHGWRTVDRLTSRDDVVDGAPAVTRERLHEELWRLLRPLEPEPRWELLMRLGVWAGTEMERNSASRALTAAEVRGFSSPGFLDIGAHTVTHPVLPWLDEPTQRGEIERSRAACEELIGQQVHAFAYPYGQCDDAAIACVRDSGFACSCTSRGVMVSAKHDLMVLPRLKVDNWRGAELMRRLAWGF
jgi:peptidoglycan/xylan/chitin deacetylase (PgdA/CDA1 family)